MCDGYNQTKDGSRLTGSTEAFQRHTVCWPRSRSEQKSSFTVIVLCMSNSLFEADTVNSNSVLSSLLIMLPATAATVPWMHLLLPAPCKDIALQRPCWHATDPCHWLSCLLILITYITLMLTYSILCLCVENKALDESSWKLMRLMRPAYMLKHYNVQKSCPVSRKLCWSP